LTTGLNQRVSALLLDVEGTTTPINFVYKVLFPYALSHAQQFLNNHRSAADVRADLEALRREQIGDARQGLEPPPLRRDTPQEEVQTAVAYMEWLTGCDRKSRPFKSLQGKIWQEGYRSGQLRAEVFEDVPLALRRWQDQKKKICIFSSGSVLAQKLLFAHTTAGDLSGYLSGYFDTSTGSKTDAASYRKIASALEKDPAEIVFISDVTGELDAARSADFETLLCVRPGNRPQPASTHEVIQSFDDVFA
jgi:enolase-phosphatase E1